jgi:hypothetical protein
MHMNAACRSGRLEPYSRGLGPHSCALRLTSGSTPATVQVGHLGLKAFRGRSESETFMECYLGISISTQCDLHIAGIRANGSDISLMTHVPFAQTRTLGGYLRRLVTARCIAVTAADACVNREPGSEITESSLLRQFQRRSASRGRRQATSTRVSTHSGHSAGSCAETGGHERL